MALRALGFITAGVLAVACGGGGLPPQSATSLAQTEASVRAAEEVGAQQVPRAALHLRYANEQLAAAQEMLREGEQEKGQRTMRRAEADAELAVALARQASAEQQLMRASRTLDAIKQEIAEQEAQQ